MNREKMQSVAFMMIANAGDAFDHFYRAISMARENDFAAAEVEMEKGKVALRGAHDSQTDLLAAEMQQRELPFSILMVHAQDHLNMAIFSERMAREFILLYEERSKKK